MRRLPIGIQDFKKIREGGHVYVDKTACIHRLINGSEGAFFLSRPRRFGKSLLCSTLGAIFESKRELFREIAGFPALAIDSLDWNWKKYPVIKLSLNIGDYTKGIDVLNDSLESMLYNIAHGYNLELRGKFPPQQFSNLIFDMQRQCNERVVVIIDEYDKPLLDNIGNKELHIEMRNALKGFYGILKQSDEHLRFVFFTGITKFSHVSLFSDLNQLNDITLDQRFSDICGLTQGEVEKNFIPEIDGVVREKEINKNEYINQLRDFYNGYRFSKKELTVYNPFGLLQHFDKSGDFISFWYETGTPTLLINLISSRKINILNMTNMRVKSEDFKNYDIENMMAEPLLYQTGYLTITDYNAEDNMFTLDFPNYEVRSCFANSLLEHYLQSSDEKAGAMSSLLSQSLQKGNVEELINVLRQFLASIPYDIIKETENYYETAIHLIFSMLGFNCRSEVRIAYGRIDTLVETKNFVYCFEFKLNGTADEALAQIETKEYLLPWQGSERKLFKIGIVFDCEKRNIGEWKYKLFKQGSK